jgi:hypothetical protein
VSFLYTSALIEDDGLAARPPFFFTARVTLAQ